MSEHFIIRGKLVAATPENTIEIPRPTGWDENQTGECPDCGGVWVWFEAGNVPGTRKCLACGSYFSVGAYGWKLTRQKFY